ncbi:hypothetical protein [Devosia psychrophila]|uniref:Uncharacterized protein n=1 Tax=Devosia psychrophila TaxID=728005 RepID=A0A0F5PXQ6_9HYPH|nr:hypothetical protein [Devosia psychrophila]KKC33166.1 hypothetical protein WH91_08900 [Devosia psychrophila]SFC29058.1 hypothetical protein SAMN04488059_103273 [Devosia psychrophila]
MRSLLFSVTSTRAGNTFDSCRAYAAALYAIYYPVCFLPGKIGRAWRLTQDFNAILRASNNYELAGSD